MIRKLSVTVLLVLLASLLTPTTVRAEKSYYAERFDVQIDLQEGGSAIITETVEFHFSGDPFSFAFREISGTETDGITFLDATMDGVAMPQGTEAGQVEVELGNPLKVTWHFPPTSNAARVFTVRYRADGIIRKDDADTFIWRAIPDDHDYSINTSTIVLNYPPQLSTLAQPSLTWDHDVTFDNGRVVLTANGIGEDQDLILMARFPLGSLAQAAPRWQTEAENRRAATARAFPVGLITGFATLVLGSLALFSYARSNAREMNVDAVASVTTNPPSDIAPAIAGKLTGQQHNFMGTIFDLAGRGVLEMQEEKGFWGSKNHMLILKEYSASLKPHEKGLLSALFKEGESQINMNEIATRLAMKNNLFDEPLEEELVQRGWLDPERKQKKTWLTAAGILMMLLPIVGGFTGMALGGFVARENSTLLIPLAAWLGICAGLFILSIALLVYAGTYSVLTPLGEEQAVRWKSFAQYLKDVSRGRESAIRPDTFEKYLAYAAVFGLGAGWAKYFQKLGGVPLPIWFHATAGGDADFGAMVAVMSASDTVGASAGGDGGGGASGGGSSGAG